MEESRIKKTGKNTIMSIIQNFANIFLQFLSRVIFVRVLSASYLGINGLFSNILNILSLADLGMQTVMMYSLYKPIAQSDTNKIVALVQFFKRVYITIACVIGIFGLALVPFLKYIINLDNNIANIECYYILALLNVVISYLFVYRTTLVMADQKSYILSKYVILFRFITFAVQIIVLFLFKSYFIYLAVAVVFSFICNLCQNEVTLKMYPFLKDCKKELNESDKKRVYSDIKAMFIYKLAGTVQGNTDNILISIFVGTIFVGYYSNYIMVITAVITVIGMIFSSVKASIGNIIASNDVDIDKKEFYYWVLELIDFWLIAFCSIAFICLFSDFIELFFGNEYVLPSKIVIASVLNFYTSNIRQALWTFRETTGIFRETQYITAVTAIINVVLSLVGGYFWGMFGIIMATVISRLLYAWWKEPIILFNKYFNKSSKQYYMVYIARFILFVLTCSVTYFIGALVKSDNLFFTFVWKIVVCCIVPNLIFLFYFKNFKEFKYLWEKLVEPLRRKVFKT